MRTLLLAALFIGVVGLVSAYTLRIRAEAIATSQHLVYAAMGAPRFPGGCPPVVRVTTLDLCAF
ncbi:MAG TPA: hypothetical protein VFB37_01550 [Steroidobacteraceae bacterium]|nr:hypothetical protein [Steroidobacteraceae bacterium]